MRRIVLIAFLFFIALLIVTAGVGWYLSGNEDFLKSQLSRIALQQTGRSLAIDGPLRLDLGTVTEFEAEGIRFSNADWAPQVDMVRIGRILVAVDLPSLWRDGSPLVPNLIIESCRIDLLVNESGEANWDLISADDRPAEQKQPATRGPAVRLPNLQIKDCRLELDTPTREEKLVAEVEGLSVQLMESGRLTGSGLGRVNGEGLEVDGWLDPLNALADGGPLEHEVTLRLGDISMRSAGSVADAEAWSGANINGYFRGPEIGKVLQQFTAPPVSEGAFDFRFRLNTEGELTEIDIDGDLGSLDTTAHGEFDRLVRPQRGRVNLTLDGPDLGALGEATGIGGLVRDAYRVEAQVVIDQGMARLETASLSTQRDKLEVDGVVTLTPDLAGSALNLRLQSNEIGRWAPLWNQAAFEAGALSASGKVAVDDAGMMLIDARAESGDHSLSAVGTLGALKGPITPSLDFAFQSADPGSLAVLIGRENFPALPLSVAGHVELGDQRIRVEDFQISLDSHRATVDGLLNLAEGHAGSEMDFMLDISDVQKLGAAFDLEGLPAEALSLTLTLRPEGKGLSFRAADGNLGTIQLDAEGLIADLSKPLAVDAVFDISLPGLDDLVVFFPGTPLPDKPFRARGRLVNGASQTRVEQIEVELGQLRAGMEGTIGHDETFDLLVQVNGPDISELQGLIGRPLQPDSFEVNTRVAGSRKEMRFSDLDARLGESHVEGQLQLALHELTHLQGDLNSERLDLSQWVGNEESEAAQPAKSREPNAYLYDDTPVMRVANYGVDLNLRLSVAELVLGPARFTEVEAALVLNPNYLELKPFSLRGRTGGMISGDVVLDGRGQTPKVEMGIHGSDVRLGLAAVEGQDPATFPPHEVDIFISGSGQTRRELASGLEGRIRWYVGSGAVASARVGIFFNDFLTELFNTLNPFAKTNEYTQLECAVVAADIVSGQVEVTPVIFHTEELTILSQGTIDLDTEKIDLSFSTKPRKGLGLSAGVLINPLIKVGGRLTTPAVELDPKGTIVSGGIAVATAGLSLLAKSMSDRFLSSADPCGDARLEIEKRDSS